MTERSGGRKGLALRTLPTARRVDYFLDHVHYVTSLFAKHYFRNDPLKEFQTGSLRDLLRDSSGSVRSVGQHLPDEELNSEAQRSGWSVTVRSGRSRRTARVHWRSPPRRGRPVLVFHPGAGSVPHDKSFQRVIPPHCLESWNVAHIEPACHRSLKDYFRRAFDSLEHLQLLFAASIQAFESVSRWAVRNGAPFVVYCGVSLGGILTSLHMCFFGSAHMYLPILAGLDVHHLFFIGSNRALVHRAKLRRGLACYRRALDFSPLLSETPRRPCFPLLAKHDLLVDYERAKQTWKGYPVSTIKRGHVSGVVSFQAMTEHLLTHVPRL